MIEDDVYRASSQYRYWSYTKESLARIRQNTNDLASERVKAAFRRVHAAKTAHNGAKGESSGNGTQNGADDLNVQTLTVEEELKVVEWGCSKITDMGEAMNPRIPSHIMVSRSLCAYQLAMTGMMFGLYAFIAHLLTVDVGYRHSISTTFLPDQLGHDI